jgi:hypothetical protein
VFQWAVTNRPDEILEKNKVYYSQWAASNRPKSQRARQFQIEQGSVLGRPAGGDGGRNRRAAAWEGWGTRSTEAPSRGESISGCRGGGGSPSSATGGGTRRPKVGAGEGLSMRRRRPELECWRGAPSR